MKKILLALLLLCGCGPTTYGLVFDNAEDPKVLAMETAIALDEWDTLVGVRHPVPLYLLGDGSETWDPGALGTCERIGLHREIRLNMDAIRALKPTDRVFRHVLFHELYHAEATCSDKDHSSDPKNLMYPYTTKDNLEALPDAAQRMAIGDAP